MRATLLVVFAVAALVSGRAAAQTTALTHATVIDGTGAAPQRDITIVMENGRIREMAPGLAVPPNATVVDLIYRGMDVNTVDSAGNTLLHLATRRSCWRRTTAS